MNPDKQKYDYRFRICFLLQNLKIPRKLDLMLGDLVRQAGCGEFFVTATEKEFERLRTQLETASITLLEIKRVPQVEWKRVK